MKGAVTVAETLSHKASKWVYSKYGLPSGSQLSGAMAMNRGALSLGIHVLSHQSMSRQGQMLAATSSTSGGEFGIKCDQLL